MRSWMGLAIGLIAVVTGLAQAQDQISPSPTLAPAASRQIVLPNASPTAPMRQGRHELTKADVDAWLDGYMPFALHSGDIPGAVVTIVKDGQLLTARGFGYADVAKRIPVDPDRTLFRPGSVSKLFTWTAVMQLVEQQKLDLDRDVNAYLDFKLPLHDGKPVTLRQIMTHTAGYEEHGKGVVFYDPKYIQALGPYLKEAAPKSIFVPGTTPAYSNWATALAGYIVQRASGEEFNAYIERHIFAPLGMRNSTFQQPLPARLADQMATGYPKPGEAAGFEFVGPGPAGALSSTGTDMARFMIANLQDGRGILSPAAAAMMHDSPLGRVNPISLLPPLNRMELGFFQINLSGHQAIGHLGDVNAFHTSLDLLMNQGIGIFISVNGAGKAGAGGELRIVLPEDFVARYLPPSPIATQGVSDADAAKHVRMMAGTWWPSRRANSSFLSLIYFLGQTDVGVGPKGGLLVSSLVGQNGRARDWIEIAPFVWQDRNGFERLAAKVVDGRVVRWSFDLAAPWEVFDRVPSAKSKAWILPAVYASLLVLILTFLFWPVAWLIRRRHKTTIDVTGRALGAYRATRIMTGFELAVLAGWALMVSSLLGALSKSPEAFDPVLWILQALGVVIFIGMVLVSAWNVWLTWTDGRRWTRKLWSVLILLASLVLLYLAAQFGLIAMTVNY